MLKKISIILICIIPVHFFEMDLIFSQEQAIFSHMQLVEDARLLVKTLESAHPDPYLNGGGKIAFHRRFQKLLASIDREGMTGSQFHSLVLPFVAAIGDSHTAILFEGPDYAQGPGLPLNLLVVEKALYVAAVQNDKHMSLIGAKLASVEGIPYEELLRRQSSLRGIENVYGKLAFLSMSLGRKSGLMSLLPEWDPMKSLNVEFINGREEVEKVIIELSDVGSQPEDWIFPDSKIIRPSTSQSDISYDFLDKSKKTALLVIENMMRYREGCESWFASGLSEALVMSQAAYIHFHGKTPPENKDELLAGIPSATEPFSALLQEMEKNGTDNLIIDLRKNTGGNGVMREILVYFLFGEPGLKSLKGGYSIKKYSDLYFQNYGSDSLEKINARQAVPLIQNDYDFSGEQSFLGPDEDDIRSQSRQETFRKMPTFWEIYQSRKYHSPRFTPEKIVVLCSPWTFSSGFNMLTALYDLGATIVGTPSAQPGNNFGDSLFFKLKNTGLQCYVSFKRIITFLDDDERGLIFRPDYEMTYEKLASFSFDPNAEILWALEILPKIKKTE